MRKRIYYIDILRAIAIILVIVGHIPYLGFSPEVHKYIYAFHIPLFFFVSGMSLCFTNYEKLNLKSNLKKRFTRIYLPYLIWAILLALPNLSLTTIPKILYGTHQSIGQVSNSSLWFLPVLFTTIIFLDVIIYYINKKNLQKYLPLLLVVLLIVSILVPQQSIFQSILGGHNLPLGIDIIPMAATFMLSGYIFQTRKQSSAFNSPFYITLPLLILFLSLSIYFALNNDVNYVLMAENRYGNYLYFFVAAFSGIATSFLTSTIIEKYTTHLSNLFQRIGSDTMMLFILHKYPLFLINDAIMLIPIAHISNLIIIPLYLLFTLLICMPLSSAIKRYAPILSGK